MSILIRGMEMPKNCAECDFCREINFEGYLWFDYYCSAKDKSFDWDDDDNKPDWCPLVEIPTPYGRLGDLDKLMTEFMDSDLDHLQRDDWKEVIQIVADAPTVIEAEGETE